jgi:hypothetical protein
MVNHWLNAAAFEKLSLFVTFRYRMLERMASCFRTLVRSARRRLVAQSGVRDSWGRCRPSFREDASNADGRKRAPLCVRSDLAVSSASTSVTLVADAAARKLLGAEERDLLRDGGSSALPSGSAQILASRRARLPLASHCLGASARTRTIKLWPDRSRGKREQRCQTITRDGPL